MRLDDDRRPPIWLERSDLTWETHQTPCELAADELDERPSLRLLLGGRSSSSRCHGNSPGVDRLSRHSIAHRPPSSQHTPPPDGGGHNFPSAA